MRRIWKLMLAVCVLTVCMASAAFAAGWTKGQGTNSSRWWYDLGNGQYYGTLESAVEWQWLDGNGDSIAECYAFDREAAQRIQAVAGGDLFEIRTAAAYPSSYQDTVNQARRELDQNARPALASRVENMNDYDIILVGFPIWWHTTPMAVNTFLESYDLSGKTILPFCTSGGSGIEESIPGVRASAGNGTVGTGLTANSLTEERIRSWLAENGI